MAKLNNVMRAKMIKAAKQGRKSVAKGGAC